MYLFYMGNIIWQRYSVFILYGKYYMAEIVYLFYMGEIIWQRYSVFILYGGDYMAEI